MKKEYLGQLTGIRYFLTLIVVLSNMALFSDVDPGFIRKLDWTFFKVLSSAPVRVDVFFMLTGFLLFYIYGQHFSKKIRIRQYFIFFIKRIIRIYPVHALVLSIIGIAYIFGVWQSLEYFTPDGFQFPHPTQNRIEQPGSFIQNITLTNAWGLVPYTRASWNGPSWSISIELINYLIFPFVAFLMMRFNKPHHFAISLLATLSLYLYIQMTWINDIGVYVGLGAIFRGFIGMILGIICAQIFLFGKYKNIAWDYIFVFVLIIIAAMMVRSLTVNDRFDYLFYIPLPFLVLSLAMAKGFIKKIFSMSWLIHLGNLSFSIYMIHQPFLQIARYFFEGYYGTLDSEGEPILIIMHLFLIVITMTIIAHLIYTYIENPVRTWAKQKIHTQKDLI